MNGVLQQLSKTHSVPKLDPFSQSLQIFLHSLSDSQPPYGRLHHETVEQPVSETSARQFIITLSS